MAVQSLYRRYRPRRFADVRGQDHVIRALRNAVATETEGHAYMFSGPRGTGKTSTARIFAKALNCTDLSDGEPCLACDSCTAIESGSSYDLFELDAASNNGVDAMRDLISRASVGSPGRTKVYILDEVHMLSPAASNALLKTLEEPPDHVKFVLATTDPQKVLPTIKSRTQHYEFGLLSANELTEFVRWVVEDAGLDVDDDAVAYAVAAGRGSARDTLSALEQVVAAGGVPRRIDAVAGLLDALAQADPAAALAAVDAAIGAGADPRILAERLMGALRDTFLSSVNVPLVHLSDAEAAAAAQRSSVIGAARITAALEAVGAAVIEMRQAPEPRIPLELALVKSVATGGSQGPNAGGATPEGSAGPELVRELATLRRRVDELEAKLAAAPESRARGTGRGTPPVPPGRSRSEQRPEPPQPAPAEPAPAEPLQPAPVPAPAPAPASAGALAIDQVRAALEGPVRDALRGIAKALFARATVESVEESTVVIALENEPTRRRADDSIPEIERVLSSTFGRPVSVTLVAAPVTGAAPRAGARERASRPDRNTDRGDSSGADPAPALDEIDDSFEHEADLVDMTELVDADDMEIVAGGGQLIERIFPGARLVDGSVSTNPGALARDDGSYPVVLDQMEMS